MFVNGNGIVSIAMNYKHITGNKLKSFIDFCFSISDKISLSQSHNIGMTKNEADKAILEYNQYLIENGYNDGIAPTDEEMIEAFKNIAETEEEMNELIGSYIEGKKREESYYKTTEEDVNAYIKEYFDKYKMTDRTVTCMTHCTHGRPTIMYFFENDYHMKEAFYNMEDLFSPVIWDEKIDLLLNDPVFYKKGKIIFSVCSHEQYATLFLDETQYNIFKQLNIPHELMKR